METTPTSTAPPQRLLGIWAHPDDETYLSAGLMARTIRNGGSVAVVTLTDGEAGFADTDLRSASDRASQRRGELSSALAAVGVDGSAGVESLGLPDGAVADAPADRVVDALVATIRRVRPDVIVTFGPDGITGHPDHVANSRLATQAWRIAGIGDLWYATKSLAWRNEWRDMHERLGVIMTDSPPALAPSPVVCHLELDGAHLDQKRRALAAHASQTEVIAEHFGEDDYRRWISEESFTRPALARPTPVQIADYCHPRRNRRSDASIAAEIQIRVAS